MIKLGGYLLHDGKKRKRILSSEFRERYRFYEEIPTEFPVISREDIDHVRRSYPGLFILTEDIRNRRMREAIELEKIGDFIHYPVKEISQEFGISLVDSLKLVQDPETISIKGINQPEQDIAMIRLREYFEKFYEDIREQEGRAIDRPWIIKNYVLLDAFGDEDFLDQRKVQGVLEAIIESLNETSLKRGEHICAAKLESYINELSRLEDAKIVDFPKEASKEDGATKKKDDVFDTTRLYLNSLSNIPLLSIEEEVGLLTKLDELLWEFGRRVYSTPYIGQEIKKAREINPKTGRWRNKIFSGLHEDEEIERLFDCLENINQDQQGIRAIKKLAPNIKEKLEKKVTEAIVQYAGAVESYNQGTLGLEGRILEGEMLTGIKPENICEFAKEVTVYRENMEQVIWKILTPNLRFVVSIIKKMHIPSEELLSAISIGNEGLYRAIQKYELGRDLKLITYAGWWINQKIRRERAIHRGELDFPPYVSERANIIRKFKNKFYIEHQRNPSFKEICAGTNLSEKDIVRSALYLTSTQIRLDDAVRDGEDSTWIEYIEDKKTKNPEREKTEREMIIEVHSVLDSLLPCEGEIIRMRSGIGEYDPPFKLEQIAEYYGMTRERIRQVEKNIMRKLKVRAKKLKLDLYLNKDSKEDPLKINSPRERKPIPVLEKDGQYFLSINAISDLARSLDLPQRRKKIGPSLISENIRNRLSLFEKGSIISAEIRDLKYHSTSQKMLYVQLDSLCLAFPEWSKWSSETLDRVVKSNFIILDSSKAKIRSINKKPDIE